MGVEGVEGIEGVEGVEYARNDANKSTCTHIYEEEFFYPGKLEETFHLRRLLYGSVASYV